jgi:endonuclease VIII
VPEGDTIARTAKRLAGALTGKVVVRFELRRDPRGRRGPQPGTLVERVSPEGKHLLIHFDDGHVLHTHMQMTGAWHVYEPGTRWRKPGHQARVVIEVAGAEAVCFNAPVVELRSSRDRRPASSALRSLERIGPDLCAPAIDWEQVAARLAATEPASSLADALLDQRIAAGIGNVYKSEVCWAHSVHPFAPLGSLGPDAQLALWRTAREQLLANVDRARRVTYDGGLAVYGRTGRPCPRCRTRIVSEMHGLELPRRTYWCPSCQPAHQPA